MVHPSTSRMTVQPTVADAKSRLLNLANEPVPHAHRSLVDDGLQLLRKYPLAGLAVAGMAGILLARSPWLRRTALKSAAGLMASRIR
jgi:hypothetical protein